jgi:predicted ester cyclase
MKNELVTRIRMANAALLERGDPEAVRAFFSAQYIVHITGEDLTGGHGMILKVMSMYRRAFSDLTTTVEILAQQKDRVAWQRTIQATQQGAFKGFPATNRRMVWREMITSRFADGLIVEEWFLTDLAEQLLLARKALKH